MVHTAEEARKKGFSQWIPQKSIPRSGNAASSIAGGSGSRAASSAMRIGRS